MERGYIIIQWDEDAPRPALASMLVYDTMENARASLEIYESIWRTSVFEILAIELERSECETRDDVEL